MAKVTTRARNCDG